MSFEWDKPIKVEQFDPGSKQTYVTETTPKFVVKNPYGFRSEDILHSLALIASEVIDMTEAQVKAITIMESTINGEEEATSEM